MATTPAAPPNPTNNNTNHNLNNTNNNNHNNSNNSNHSNTHPHHPPPHSPTTTTPPQFNSSECSKYLSSRHTAAMEALASNQLNSNEKPELFKPPGTSSLAGGWASGKYTSMANGQDFLTCLCSKLDAATNSSLLSSSSVAQQAQTNK